VPREILVGWADRQTGKDGEEGEEKEVKEPFLHWAGSWQIRHHIAHRQRQLEIDWFDFEVRGGARKNGPTRFLENDAMQIIDY
jgi:hypothetical protein